MAGNKTRFLTGNQAARKFTVEDARDIFRKVLEVIEEDETILYLNTAAKHVGHYVKRLNYLADIYAHDEEVVELGQRIESELEERLVTASLGGKCKEATAIFLMKARFDMHETHRIQQVSDGDQEGSPVQRKLEEASPEQLEQLRNAILALEQQDKADGDGDREAQAEVVE